MEKEARITNPDGKSFRATRKIDPRYGDEPIIVFTLDSGQATGASYFVSSLMENLGEESDLCLHGGIPEWWVSFENLVEVLKTLFTDGELDAACVRR